MDRMKLTSTEARTRVKNFINERYRAVATSCGLTSVRWGYGTIITVAESIDYPVTGIIHPVQAWLAVGNSADKILRQITSLEFLELDPAQEKHGEPQAWSHHRSNAATATVRLWPIPDDEYSVGVGGIMSGTDMSADGDVPVLPEDFHDALIFGALSDELMEKEKPQLADAMEAKFKERVRELRYFVNRTAYLEMRQGEHDYWWWGYWWGTYRG